VIAVIFLIMMTVLVPVFKKLFASLGGKLPTPTRILIQVSDTLVSWHVLVVIALAVGGIIGFRRWIKTPSGRLTWDKFKLRPPIFGPLAHKAALSRFSSTLSSMLKAGVPALEALDIVANSSGNALIQQAVLHVKARVREGRTFAEPMKEMENVFPMLIIQMVEVGEQTGALDEMLERVSEFYNGEVDQTVDNLTSILEPFLVIIMGAVVGTIIICLYLPMFDYIKLLH
jgi:type IV pilus assembly protein PilC